MKAILLLLAAALFASGVAADRPTASPPLRHTGVLNPDRLGEVIPPERFQGDVGAITIFSNALPRSECAPTALACVVRYRKGPTILFAPNPCSLAGKELYATILCHELGHLNRWPETHGD